MLFSMMFYIQNITIIVNGSAILPCSGTNIRWLRYIHIPIHEEVIYEDNTKVGWYFADDRYTMNKTDLQISNARNTNRGHYLCVEHSKVLKFYNVMVEGDDGDDYEYISKFNRFQVPNVSFRNISIREGDTLDINCTSHSRGLYKLDSLIVRYYPIVKVENNTLDDTMMLYSDYFNNYYYSKFNKVTAEQTDKDFKVSVKHMSQCDSGYYECSVLNSNPSTILLYVRVTPAENWRRKSTREIDYARRVRNNLNMIFRRTKFD